MVYKLDKTTASLQELISLEQFVHTQIIY